MSEFFLKLISIVTKIYQVIFFSGIEVDWIVWWSLRKVLENGGGDV
jgi:hypothetical protein